MKDVSTSAGRCFQIRTDLQGISNFLLATTKPVKKKKLEDKDLKYKCDDNLNCCGTNSGKHFNLGQHCESHLK